MQLTTNQINTIEQNTGLKVVPDDHESIPQLRDAFGSHTFFLSENGLLILDEENVASQQKPLARLFIVAVWEDEQSSALTPQTPPADTDVVIDLDSGQARPTN